MAKSNQKSDSFETFMILLSSGDDTIDWRWPSGEPRWVQSDRENSVKWDGPRQLTEMGREVLIDRFGLWDVAYTMPLAAIQLLSPAELMAHRRRLEKKNGLECICEVVSDRVGGQIEARLAV